jgi:hypothetical protein
MISTDRYDGSMVPELNGKISDKLREKFPAEAQEWNPPRPGEPKPPLPEHEDKWRRMRREH